MVNTRKNKSTAGRQKVEIKRIEDEESRQVCFSKRRTGLFKKATDLSILCGAEVGIIIFSPGGNVFSFGHPSLASVIEHFLSGANNANAANPPDNLNVHALIEQHSQLTDRIKVEQQKKGELEKALKAREPLFGEEDANFEGMDVEKRKGLLEALQRLRRDVEMRNDEILLQSIQAGNIQPASTLGGGASAGGSGYHPH